MKNLFFSFKRRKRLNVWFVLFTLFPLDKVTRTTLAADICMYKGAQLNEHNPDKDTHTHKHTLQSRLALVFARLAPFAPPTQYCHILACHMDSETDKAALSTTGWGCVCACVCIRAQVCAWEWERVLEFRLRLSRQRQTSPIKSPSSV